ncbi:hypothetical protein ACHWQZ_G011023, partial [Mnemiopsis leidyi]
QISSNQIVERNSSLIPDEQKYRSQRSSASVTLLKKKTLKEDLTLLTNLKPHSHLPVTLVAKKLEFRQSLMRKAADRQLSATQRASLSGCS